MTDPVPTAGWFEGKTHHLPVRVYYEDTDFSGIVYHASYLRFMERGRTDFLRLAGLEQGALFSGEEKSIFVVHRMTLEFLKPARVDDALVVKTVFSSKGGVRIFGDQQILRGEDLLIRARVEVVVIDEQGRPKRPSERLADALKPFINP